MKIFIAVLLITAIWGIRFMVINPPSTMSWSHQDRLEQEIDNLEEHIEILNSNSGGAVPQWFKDEFKETFAGSYAITVDDEILNIVVITSNKRFDDLCKTIIDPDDFCAWGHVWVSLSDWEIFGGKPDDKENK